MIGSLFRWDAVKLWHGSAQSEEGHAAWHDGRPRTKAVDIDKRGWGTLHS
jgi:hypothetical protein